eukprot:m.123193 g.123193  ORF g.123193 m.123193 type:complete len:552 (-) comp13748_c0_seq1:3844-5499(-)
MAELRDFIARHADGSASQQTLQTPQANSSSGAGKSKKSKLFSFRRKESPAKARLKQRKALDKSLSTSDTALDRWGTASPVSSHGGDEFHRQYNSYDFGNRSQYSITSWDSSMGDLHSQQSSIVDMNDDFGALPPGWSTGKTEDGRVYFIDAVHKKTTWLDPRTNRPYVDASTRDREAVETASPYRDIPLPPGWEMSLADDGTPYFVDHINKKTTWEDPRSKVVVPTMDEQTMTKIAMLRLHQAKVQEHIEALMQQPSSASAAGSTPSSAHSTDMPEFRRVKPNNPYAQASALSPQSSSALLSPASSSRSDAMGLPSRRTVFVQPAIPEEGTKFPLPLPPPPPMADLQHEQPWVASDPDMDQLRMSWGQAQPQHTGVPVSVDGAALDTSLTLADGDRGMAGDSDGDEDRGMDERSTPTNSVHHQDQFQLQQQLEQLQQQQQQFQQQQDHFQHLPPLSSQGHEVDLDEMMTGADLPTPNTTEQILSGAFFDTSDSAYTSLAQELFQGDSQLLGTNDPFLSEVQQRQQQCDIMSTDNDFFATSTSQDGATPVAL